MRTALALLTIICTEVLPAVSQAQAYPAKPVRLILSYPPGGATDALGRMVARALADAWSVTVIADNRPGASGNIGTTQCVKSPPDGYTMCVVAPAQAMASRLVSNPPFDSLKDFSHVTQIASMPMLLLVHPALPVRNVAELIALAKRKPGAMNYASSGGGASHHLAMEMFKQQAGVDIVLITYKGGGAQLVDQLAGRIEVAFNLAVGVVQHVKTNRLRAIAVSTRERFSTLSEVPTVGESGLNGYEASSWQGLSMPAGVPRAIVRHVQAEVSKNLNTPEIRESLLGMGAIALGSTAEEFATFFNAESDKWFKVAKAANVRLE